MQYSTRFDLLSALLVILWIPHVLMCEVQAQNTTTSTTTSTTNIQCPQGEGEELKQHFARLMRTKTSSQSRVSHDSNPIENPQHTTMDSSIPSNSDLPSSYEQGYRRGYEQGYAQGYAQGYEQQVPRKDFSKLTIKRDRNSPSQPNRYRPNKRKKHKYDRGQSREKHSQNKYRQRKNKYRKDKYKQRKHKRRRHKKNQYRQNQHNRYQAYDAHPNAHQIMNGYKRSKSLLFDQVEGRSGILEGVYTGRRFKRASHGGWKGGVNCEHVWPRSWMSRRGSALFRQQEADMHNLYPSRSKTNQTRSSFPFGMLAKDTSEDQSKLGKNQAREKVFQVRKQRRGDIARTMFYFATRWSLSLHKQDIAILTQWHQEDPVDQREQERNDLIEKIQGNRNWFIDCPQAITKIW